MCDCKEVKELPSLKIYTYMGTYKAKLNKGASVKNGVTIFWETATQEEWLCRWCYSSIKRERYRK